ncbi:ABC-three component system middle component 2 [Tardiphaga sp. 839_C3_N1_4]|uniref:ABC-three component system middle component 2 n=1 Tax=Tardiphaga sp. 839_C3_N1_4 TaxID=3240761 RepID=UPI003F20FD0E
MNVRGQSPQLFNSPLEAGLRAVIILDAFSPEAFDLKTLCLLDYFLVHTGDADGPESIHPDLEAREGEYFIRRRLVEEGIALMVRGFLIDRLHKENGISFRARDTAGAMVDLMNTPYNNRLKTAAQWIADRASESSLERLLEGMKTSIDRWTLEVIGEPRQ